MFGTLRTILALMVVLHHLNPLPGINIGVAAVIDFFIISGYVMTVLIQNNYSKLGRSTLYFYADRFLRIYPQFFFFLVLAQIGDLLFHFQEAYLSGGPTVLKFILNALIVPMNYFLFSPYLVYYQLILPAWSLGLEEQFYWIFPLLLLLPFLGRISLIISMVVFSLAIFSFIPLELFAYRLLPGVIFIFLLGKSLAVYNTKKSKEAFLTMVGIYLFIISIATIALAKIPGVFAWDYNKPEELKILIGILAGVLIGFPIIAFLSRCQRRKWDEVLGHASYGIFLSHILIKDLFLHFKIHEILGPQWSTITVMVCATAAGFGGYYFIEKLVNPFRFALRRKHREFT